MDEKPVPLIGDIRDCILPNQPGDILKKDYEYERNGSVNVFCAVEPKAGKYINIATKQRCGSDFAKFIKLLYEKYSHAEKIVLVMDNLSTHKEKHLIEYYGEQEGKKLWSKFEVHYTPKHGVKPHPNQTTDPHLIGPLSSAPKAYQTNPHFPPIFYPFSS